MQKLTIKDILAEPKGLMFAVGITAVIAVISALLLSSYIGSNNKLTKIEYEKAFRLIKQYSEIVESGPPSKEKTEFIAVTLVVLGDDELSRDEVKEIKYLYSQVPKTNDPMEYR